jgi:hypothetical protein
MNPIEFSGILPKENNYRKLLLIARTFFLFVIPAIIYIFFRHKPMVGTLNFTLYFLWFCGSIFLALLPFFIYKIKFLKPFELFGSVIFSDEGVKINYEQYYYSQITNLSFYYGGIDGEALQYQKRFASISEGVNTISFNKGEDYITTNFYLENENQKDELQNVLTNLYESRIKFNETNNQGKTYVLYNLNEQQASEFREKFQLDSL